MKILNKLNSSNKTSLKGTPSFKIVGRWLAVILTVLFIHSPAVSAAEGSLEKIIAIVDDDVLLASELNERVQQILNKIKQSGQQDPPMDQIQKDILDQLILENIQMQLARRAGLRISDAQLTASVERIARQNNMTLDQFTQALKNEGQSYISFREQVRKDTILQQIQKGNVNQRIKVTPQEIANFLQSEEGASVTAPEYRMLHTLIPLPAKSDGATDEKAKKLADELFEKIQNGQDYAKAIGTNGQTELSISDLGWRKSKDLPSIFSGLAAALQKNETAAPLKSAGGYHLVKLLDKRGDGEIIPQTKASHILLKPSAIRDDVATEAALKALRQRAIDGEDFAELAREHSEDIGSAAEGGDLGWTSPGQMVPVFQDAMELTEDGEISTVFRSQFGWHVLRVAERRDEDITDKLRDNMAHGFIHKRKYDDELQAWLQKIRDEAYVDIK
ncbi:MAG: peptidyl-prolyl cis-trans isomerase SurA [Oceanicoccus sp.]|jgi:peptidyl-prolyl cis-trans isomerase SurA